MLTKKDKENLEFFYNYLKNQGFKDFDKKDKLQSLKKLINKPVETTNEQPKEEDLEMWFEDQKNIQYPIIYSRPKKYIEVQLTGMSIYLNPNGTYFLSDTTGG